MTASRRTRPLTAAALLVLLASACGGGGGRSTHAQASQPGSAPTSAPSQRINDGGTFDARGHSTVQVIASNFRFSPSTILGTPGQVLTLVVHNTSQTPHNIKAAGGVDSDLDPGSTHTVHVTVPASGELVFWCEYHKAAGMAGQVGPQPAGTSGTSPSGGSGGGNYGGGY